MEASELRPGMAVRLEGDLYKVITASFHAGGGQLTGVTHVKLRNMRTGAVREWRFKPDERVEDVVLARRTMQFLYRDADLCHFMDLETYEQIAIDAARLGRSAAFLVEGMALPVEFSDGQPVGVVFPDIVELRVADTAPPTRAVGTESVWKEARLDNGMTIMVPPFVAPGEVVRIDVETATYIERAKRK